MRTPADAVAWLRHEAAHPSADWTALCERLARSAYGLPANYPTAEAHAAAIPADRRHGHNPGPAGGLVLYRNSGAGHIVVLLGDGHGGRGWRAMTNDSPQRRGRVHEVDDARTLAPWCHAREWFTADPWWTPSNAHRLAWGTTSTAPGFPGTIRQGSTGAAVRAWQAEMIRRGRISDNPANRDGVCGPGMVRALRALQAAEGIVVDGVGGPQTWTALVT